MGQAARSHVRLGYTRTWPPRPGDAKGKFDGGRSRSHTQEECRALAELNAGLEKARILLEGLAVDKERKNCRRITSRKKGSPIYNSFTKTLGLPPIMPRQR